ncbi:filamentous hemagglutinin family protein [Herbaspirillum sp. alder98]|uniref:filamentous hemagglutinin family protein n=1 Tax=Herbaspirillum sp. alder98 TaxID=2913096 RepID=UPI001CD869D6|nr:filamentous hemagglutinin family protein [Herbaspirillum sp. alder98]MCA1325573.1 filamentous hemagglutinin family protein [Herbaspirillum sp. alder98]
MQTASPSSFFKRAQFKRAPIAHAVALLLATAGTAHAQKAFSPAWFANKGVVQSSAASTGYLPNGTPASALTNPAQQQQQANAQLQTSLNNLTLLARGIAASQAAQAAARQAALANGGSVPDGLGEGGLKVDTNSLTQGWLNANAPTQTTANGKTTVNIQQTADKAILNWETFNVGQNTLVNFAQQASWAVLNRVNDPLARPSQIQGQIKGDGTVMIVNRNGVIFSGSSQVNTRNLVVSAANISDAQFRSNGLYVDNTGSQPSFTNAQGRIEVQAGAQIATAAPASATQGGGYVLLMGRDVSNAGQINTAGGQTTLAAGDSFTIRRGVSTDGNTTSTTRGNEVSTQGNGRAINTGLITASTGDITLTGHEVVQAGVAVSTTSVATRGTIHLLNRASDTSGSVTLAEGSSTAVLLDQSAATALDSQRDAALKNLDGVKTPNNIVGVFDNLSNVTDRGDLSRIEIVSGNTVEFKNGSSTLATGGQIAVSARQRSLVGSGAVLDVAGAVGVSLAMDSNNILVNVQGNELRDAAGNRDGGLLNNSNVWVDRRSLVLVPAGTNGYATDRWYTAGGLLEVSGYLATGGHGVGEWMALGGTVNFAGKEVVTQAGSTINLSGGTLNVQTGYVKQSWMKGADGRLYELSSAPGDLLYNGMYKGFEVAHSRWGANTTEYYYNPLIAPQRRLEDGYTVGRDAGRLVIATESAVLEGTLTSDVYQGPRQTQAAQAGLDGYYQSQTAAARRGQLVIGQYVPRYDSTAGILRYGLTPTTNSVTLAAQVAAIADSLSLGNALPADRIGNIVIDSDRINAAGLGGLIIGAKGGITVDSAVTLANGGALTLYASTVNVNADVTAHGGTMNLGNVLLQNSSNNRYEDSMITAGNAAVTVAAGVKLDASGQWSNLKNNPGDSSGLPALNGGTVSIRSSRDVVLGAGSLIDVSSGAAMLASGEINGGRGGNVRLQNDTGLTSTGQMTLGGEVRGHGVSGGGTLSIETGRIQIGGAAAPAGTLQLAADSFNKGFASYALTGLDGVTVADGAQVNVSMPVLRAAVEAGEQPTGSPLADALEVWTPPLVQEDPVKGRLTQRRGASLSLQAGSTVATAAAARLNTSVLRVGRDAGINVDPGQSISLYGIGQVTVDRGVRLNAWGGNITLGQLALSELDPTLGAAYLNADRHSLWVGEGAVLDVAARAMTATDARGRTYGTAGAGGSIVIGGTVDPRTGLVSTRNLHVFVAIREGALLDASGSQASVDIDGMGKTVIAGNGGSIALAAGDGLYLDGVMRAAAGASGAAGGSLSVALDLPSYMRGAKPAVLAGRQFIIGQQALPSALTAGLSDIDGTAQMAYGHARLGVDQVQAGGFGQLTLFARGGLFFDGNIDLNMRQSLQLYSSDLTQIDALHGASHVNLSAPYVRLAGVGNFPTPTPDTMVTPRGVPTVVRPLPASLTIDGSLVDIRDGVSLDFSSTTFDSSGDLRFLASVNASAGIDQYSTVVTTQGDIILRAAQIYPATNAMASVQAGLGGGKEAGSDAALYKPDSFIRIERNGTELPALPYSVFGALQLGAATIEQGGILRAPLGAIALGGASNGFTTRINLLPGSLTSVSAAGLVMPYGGTVDGISYTYDGANVVLSGIGGVRSTNNTRLSQGVSLTGTFIDVRAGAVMDMTGGGELTGAGFISGRGGSTDARTSPLMQVGTSGRFVLPGLLNNPIYAIVPGVQAAQAPGVSPGGAVDPLIGQQITIGAGVPGLAAGTYTLMPSTYALLPGAFRVELNGSAGLGAAFASSGMRNGSTSVAAQLSIAGTGIADTLFRQAIVTSGKTLRSYSQYNEMNFAQFVMADAVRRGIPRAMTPDDGKALRLTLRTGGGGDAFQFDGTADFSAARSGYDGSLVVMTQALPFQDKALEIVGPGAGATAGFVGVTLRDETLNKLKPGSMNIGSAPVVTYGQAGSVIDFFTGDTGLITLRSGATLRAPQVMLVTSDAYSGHRIVVEQGASINTIGRGKVAYDARDGFVYTARGDVLAVSNGLLNFIPALASTEPPGNNGISIGGCTLVPCMGATELYSEGSIAAVTSSNFQMDDAVRYGTRNLTLAVSSVNAGTPQALADAAARNALPFGFSLNQDVLNRLLAGDTRYGAPALETLILSARDSFNFYGTTSLSTLDASTGKSSLANLVLNTPAIYGYGNAGDVATIQTGNLIWNGGTSAAGNVVAQGAGTGSGTLDLRAERIEFGYAPFTQPSSLTQVGRLALGFANVNLAASDRVTANHKGSLAVYQSQGAYDSATGYQYSGGNLNITAPLVTGAAGSVNRLTAGGTLTLSTPASGAAKAGDNSIALGAELSLSGREVVIDSTVALPSGKLSITAERDLRLDQHATLDMAGRKISFFDVDKYSWGGDVLLESSGGNVRQNAASVIDLSAQNNRGGTLKVTALSGSAGVVDLQGSILGAASGHYEAGGSLAPYLAGSIDVRARKLGDSGSLDEQFAALNQRLNTGGVVGARSFQLTQGDLTIGSGVKASEVNVSLDNGNLSVTGTIDASGERVGTIRLAANGNLTIAGSAVLDAHGSGLRVDSYGKIIDSPNRAIIELGAGESGQLTLASGARIDLRHGTAVTSGNDGAARGTLTLNAFRTGETSGDIRIDAGGNLDIVGARSIAVNAMWRYIDAPDGTDPLVTRPYQEITQAYLNDKHVQSTAFMTAALANGNLMNSKLGGLRSYQEAFHLRPGVEIASKTADGDLVVRGDLDLSGYRYASVNPNTPMTGVIGSGEAGSLTLRAGGNLDVYGSINDGFAPPPATMDDNGWLLLPGINFTGDNVVVPRSGVVLDDGTIFEAGKTLNYDLPIKARMFSTGQVIPVASVLAAPLTLTAGTVLSADVRDASGNLLHAAGSIIATTVTLPADTRFDAGMRLPGNASLAAMVWPKGVMLAGVEGQRGYFVMNGATTLPIGALIPGGTDIKLAGGATSVDLRDRVGGSQGKLWAVAAMLPEGSQSWSLRLTAGADRGAADSRITRAGAVVGSLRLADSHYGVYGLLHQDFGWSQLAVDDMASAGIVANLGDPVDPEQLGMDNLNDVCVLYMPEYCIALGPASYQAVPSSTRFSVVRTGAADMDLLAARDVRMDTLYGVYTAGVSSTPTRAGDPYNLPRARNSNGTVLGDVSGYFEKLVDGGADSLARAWYPTDGGNLTVKAGGDLIGNQMMASSAVVGRPNRDDSGFNSAETGNWLWRQGSATALGGGQDQLSAWWINFGSYVSAGADKVVGFTGLGALGGGNLRIEAGGNAGTVGQTVDQLAAQQWNRRTQSLVLAVGSTGRVAADGSLSLTGGGDIDVRIGGALNPVSNGFVIDGIGGTIVDLRGNVQVQAAEMGRMTMSYALNESRAIPGETRALNAFVATRAELGGGLLLVPGDATFALSSRGDQVIGNAIDPGRTTIANATPMAAVVPDPSDPTRSLPTGSGTSWFSLWTNNTAISLFSAGGNLSPIMSGRASDLSVVYPGRLSAVAASGSLYYGLAGTTSNNSLVLPPLLLAPSSNGQLEFLARDSIFSGGYTVTQSAAASSSMATPLHPAFLGTTASGAAVSNLNSDGSHVVISGEVYPLFAFGAGTASGEPRSNGQPARFYAVDGDLLGVSSGRALTFTQTWTESRAGQSWYEGAQPVWMKAGRDIVSSGSRLGVPDLFERPDQYTAVNNLFVHGGMNDVSVVSAGRDILYSSFAVAGPGTLEITAGRNIQMDNKVGVNSIGPVVTGDQRPGASIVMQAGVGAGADYVGLIARYLDPANLMAAGASLASQPGKVAKTYENELAAWLTERYGFAGSTEQVRAFYAALPAEQQRVFARRVYFAELAAGGREYNDINSPRSGSYLRGRNMIASLFPGVASGYGGDITMFGDAGVHTRFGGDIQMLTPGGRQVFGVEGTNPAGSAGVITQGAGNIQMYALGSILLGQSRIMTTFGGDVLAWSAAGDINAGRGSKTTVVYTPPKRVYDRWGNVTLSSDVPSTGAGIATLAPIAEVPAGDIDLIAPLGTIDAGEAGIRVSGNVNIAALQVVNAANIQVQGKSTGLPVVASVNVGALSNASAAASSAAMAAQDAVSRDRAAARQNLPSVFTVRVLGFGNEPTESAPAAPAAGMTSMTPDGKSDRASPVQVIGLGNTVDNAQLSRLTEQERRALKAAR